MNPAVLTKQVLRDTGIELIYTQGIAALEQLEAIGRDDRMNKPFFGTHRAVAVDRSEVIELNPKAHCTAVTAAGKNLGVGDRQGHGLT